MDAPENMEAEIMQAPDNAPTLQNDEIDERGVEAAPAMEEERALESTMGRAGEWPQVEERRRTLSNDHPYRPRRGSRTGWKHLKSSNPATRRVDDLSETTRTWKGALCSGVQAGKKVV